MCISSNYMLSIYILFSIDQLKRTVMELGFAHVPFLVLYCVFNCPIYACCIIALIFIVLLLFYYYIDIKE